MLKYPKFWDEWEKNYQRREPTDFAHNLRMMEAMYAEARDLKIFQSADPLEGLETKIRIAKALNVSKAA